ncbi:MAG: amino acid permease [Cyanobacteria bacterium SID2]|nr:amino acid permease [Cyanobacteria bacterium SID2]
MSSDIQGRPTEPPQPGNTRAISLFTASSLVVANTIGTGVFTSLGFQAADIRSGFSLLLLWVIGGVFAFCGALAYGELSALMPRSGGEYHFLSKIYHPAIGFLSGWISVTVGFAAPIALSAMALGEYFSQVFPGLHPVAIALFVTIGISIVHSRNRSIGSYFQNSTTLLKVTLIVVFIICGLSIATPQTLSFLPSNENVGAILSAPFAVSLIFVTYSYSGWNAAVYLASEVEHPQRNVPRALLLGTGVVMVLYVLLNFVFLYTTPIDALAGQLEVGYIAANSIFGEVGAKLMGLLISFGLVSSISAMVWAGPRVTQVIGEDFPIFQRLSRTNRHGVPYYALWLQLAIVVGLVLTSTFEAVLTYLGFTLTISSLLTVAGVFVLRVTQPNTPRPYKTWGYPLTPIVFIGISLWILVFVFSSKPVESIAGLATIALGFPVYLFAAKRSLVSSKSQSR